MNLTSNLLLIVLTLLFSAKTLQNTFKQETLSFSKGIQAGFCYFIGFPIILLLFSGEIRAFDLSILPLTLDSNPTTFFVICLFALAVLILSSFRPQRESSKNISTSQKKIIILISLYLFISVYLFLGSGKLAGGHWHTSLNDQLSGNSTNTLLAVIKNSLRFAMPGYVLFAFKQKKINYYLFCLLLAVVAINELITSSNRILLLICIAAYVVGIGIKDKKKIITLILVAPMVLYINSIFPMIRGAMWSNGADIQHLTETIKNTAETHITNSAFDTLYDATEATNLTMIDLVVAKYPNEQDYLMGETVILRSLLFFIPKSIWPDRPETFSITVGKLSGSRVDGLALNSTFIGELYANFSLLSPIVFLGIFVLLSALSKFFRRADSFYAAFFCALGAWRFDFVFLVVSFIVILIIELASRLKTSLPTKQRTYEKIPPL